MAEIGKVKCGACDGAAVVKEGKGGTLSILCQDPGCRSLAMVKSPDAVQRLRARLAREAGGGTPPKPAPAAPAQTKNDFLGSMFKS